LANISSSPYSGWSGCSGGIGGSCSGGGGVEVRHLKNLAAGILITGITLVFILIAGIIVWAGRYFPWIVIPLIVLGVIYFVGWFANEF
jgi:hypothetical protein